MTRAPLVAATTAAALLLAIPSSAAAASGLRLTKANGPAFPVRTWVLSLPNTRALNAGDLQVTEDATAVSDVQLVPASKASPTTFGVVLVLDTSWSMRGKPLAAALKAAKSFVETRNPNAQLGAIYFNRTATTVLPLTTSATTISQALATPPTPAKGTHIFDAVAQAEAMLKARQIGSGSIVVLSDGADTGSTKSRGDVAHAALAANARIYTIGLDDSSYRPHTLASLAAAGHGEYVKAKAGALAPLFAKLGRILSNEYQLSYTSPYGPGTLPGTPIHVAVSIHDVGTAVADYRTPRPAAGGTGGSGNPSIGTRIVTSTVTMIALAILVALVIGVLVVGVLQPRRTRLPARIAEFVSIRNLQRDRGRTVAGVVNDERAERKDAWTRFGETLKIARIGVAPEALIAGAIVATVLLFLLIYAGTGSPWWALFALGVPYIVREWVLRTLKRLRNRFAEQLPDALQVISSALHAGHSFAGSLAVVVEGASEPMRSELQRVVADEQLGMPVQVSLGVVADRMASTDVDQLALVAELQRQAGGNMAEVIDRVAETVRERFDLKRLVETLTMQGRMSRWIVSALPIVILLVLQFENPHYFHPLVASTAGKVLVGIAAAWAVVGSLVIKKIVEIEV